MFSKRGLGLSERWMANPSRLFFMKLFLKENIFTISDLIEHTKNQDTLYLNMGSDVFFPSKEWRLIRWITITGRGRYNMIAFTIPNACLVGYSWQLSFKKAQISAVFSHQLQYSIAFHLLLEPGPCSGCVVQVYNGKYGLVANIFWTTNVYWK